MGFWGLGFGVFGGMVFLFGGYEEAYSLIDSGLKIKVLSSRLPQKGGMKEEKKEILRNHYYIDA